MPWLILGLFFGFLAGVSAFKVKSRWCPRCGEKTFPHPPSERRR